MRISLPLSAKLIPLNRAMDSSPVVCVSHGIVAFNSDIWCWCICLINTLASSLKTCHIMFHEYLLQWLLHTGLQTLVPEFSWLCSSSNRAAISTTPITTTLFKLEHACWAHIWVIKCQGFVLGFPMKSWLLLKLKLQNICFQRQAPSTEEIHLQWYDFWL